MNFDRPLVLGTNLRTHRETETLLFSMQSFQIHDPFLSDHGQLGSQWTMSDLEDLVSKELLTREASNDLIGESVSDHLQTSIHGDPEYSSIQETLVSNDRVEEGETSNQPVGFADLPSRLETLRSEILAYMQAKKHYQQSLREYAKVDESAKKQLELQTKILEKLVSSDPICLNLGEGSQDTQNNPQTPREEQGHQSQQVFAVSGQMDIEEPQLAELGHQFEQEGEDADFYSEDMKHIISNSQRSRILTNMMAEEWLSFGHHHTRIEEEDHEPRAQEFEELIIQRRMSDEVLPGD